MPYFLGVDVGTGSARAGVFDEVGILKGTFAHDIPAFRPRPGYVQQSSADIWTAVSTAIRGAVNAADIGGAEVAGIGFDATCSLVVTDAASSPVSVCPDGASDQDVIVWMDHRALKDAEEINKIGGAVLSHVGGTISPEMEMPKLRWLKRELPDSWATAARFYDLPDWLVHRATGGETRSLCSTVCKWTYLGHKGRDGVGWDNAFLDSIGLSELTQDNHAAIGATLAAPGDVAGHLSATTSAELGLAEGTPVSASLIDAYAGALGTLGVAGKDTLNLTERLAVIAGTSTCHIGVSVEPVFVPGVWGPYFDVMLPGLWANEGGQSAAGALLDAVIARHSAADYLRAQATGEGRRISELLDARLTAMGPETAILTHDRHVQPDFIGNRSPLAEPERKGAIVGLTLDTGADDLALDYLATIQALAYGTRHIIEEMRAAGAPIGALVVSGGLARNALFVREMADATGAQVIVPAQTEPVMLGSAILGAVAGGAYPDLESAMTAMSGSGEIIEPRADLAAYHTRKYRVFRQMQRDYAHYLTLMQEESLP